MSFRSEYNIHWYQKCMTVHNFIIPVKKRLISIEYSVAAAKYKKLPKRKRNDSYYINYILYQGFI